jgi:2-isopropylmalate synthase
VDAAYKAVDKLVGVDCELIDYSMNSVSGGIEALAHTRVLIQPSGKLQSEAFVETPGSINGKVKRSFSGELPADAPFCRCSCVVMQG